METQEETVFRCDRCDQDFPITERIEFEGDQYCSDCFNAVTVICSCCGERICRDENYGNDSTPLCENCYDRNYTTCTHCDRLLHYPKLGVYLYASTSEILKSALQRINIPNDTPKEIKLECGDIIKISRDGSISRSEFDASELLYTSIDTRPYTFSSTSTKSNYLSQLREMAMSFGYSPEMVDRLSAHGFSPEEIEEFFYEGMCEC